MYSPGLSSLVKGVVGSEAEEEARQPPLQVDGAQALGDRPVGAARAQLVLVDFVGRPVARGVGARTLVE